MMVYKDWGVLMNITVLTENTKQKNSKLNTEHGLSLLVENNGRTVLFDTGGSKGSAIQNSRKLNLELSHGGCSCTITRAQRSYWRFT